MCASYSFGFGYIHSTLISLSLPLSTQSISSHSLLFRATFVSLSLSTFAFRLTLSKPESQWKSSALSRIKRDRESHSLEFIWGTIYPRVIVQHIHIHRVKYITQHTLHFQKYTHSKRNKNTHTCIHQEHIRQTRALVVLCLTRPPVALDSCGDDYLAEVVHYRDCHHKKKRDTENKHNTQPPEWKNVKKPARHRRNTNKLKHKR